VIVQLVQILMQLWREKIGSGDRGPDQRRADPLLLRRHACLSRMGQIGKATAGLMTNHEGSPDVVVGGHRLGRSRTGQRAGLLAGPSHM